MRWSSNYIEHNGGKKLIVLCPDLVISPDMWFWLRPSIHFFGKVESVGKECLIVAAELIAISISTNVFFWVESSISCLKYLHLSLWTLQGKQLSVSASIRSASSELKGHTLWKLESGTLNLKPLLEGTWESAGPGLVVNLMWSLVQIILLLSLMDTE